MPAESDEPLRKVTLNLYASDVEWLERRHGRGWTEAVRGAVRSYRRKDEDKQFNLQMER